MLNVRERQAESTPRCLAKGVELAPPPQCLSHQSYYRLSLPRRKHCVEQRTAACVLYALFMSLHFRRPGRTNCDRTAQRSIGIRTKGCV